MLTLLAVLLGGVGCQELVTFTLGNLGNITGRETMTKVYEGAPHSARTFYKFRNIPYALPVVGENRFKQSQIWNNSLLSTEGAYDATRTGPLCMQGSITPQYIDSLKTTTVGELVIDLILIPSEIPEILYDTLVTVLLEVLNIMLELESGFLEKDKFVFDILHDWLDIDIGVSEDCLHLSVSTPWKPDSSEQSNLYPWWGFLCRDPHQDGSRETWILG